MDIDFVFDPRSAGWPLAQPTHAQQLEWRQRRKASHDPPWLPKSPFAGLALDMLYPNLCRLDIQLLHHFATITTPTFAPRYVLDRWLFKLIPTMVQPHTFVRHALLGVSALHQAMIRPDGDRTPYRSIALQHLSQGMLAFRTSVNQLNPQNNNAIFIFSGISLVWELALLHPSYEIYHNQQHPIDRLVQVFRLCRNIIALWRSFPPSFYHAIPLNLRVDRGTTNTRKPKTTINKLQRIQDTGLVPPEVTAKVSFLHDLNCATTTDLVEQHIYSKVIDQLYITFYKIVKHPGNWTLALRWPFSVSEKFTQLLQARRPLAIVLLSYYCVLVYHGTNQWWMKDWSQHILHLLSQLLNEQWIVHISWALQAIQDGCQSPFHVVDGQRA